MEDKYGNEHGVGMGTRTGMGMGARINTEIEMKVEGRDSLETFEAVIEVDRKTR